MSFRILIVDDEENMLALLKRVLGKEGYQITAAESGEKALDLIRQQDFEAAVVDIIMPGMDGIDLLTRIKTIRSACSVIMITAFPSWELEQQARGLGCVDFLHKPLDLKRLKGIIKTLSVKKDKR